MDTCISMESVGIPDPSTRGHIPHMFFIHSCRTPMPHSHSHVLACQPHSLAMMCEAWFPPLELGLSHSDIPYMFPAEACGFPWAKIRTIIGCRSDLLTNHWGFSVYHSMDDSHHGNHAWFLLVECYFPQPKIASQYMSGWSIPHQSVHHGMPTAVGPVHCSPCALFSWSSYGI